MGVRMVEDDRSYHQHLAEAVVQRARAVTMPNFVKVYYRLAEAYLKKITLNAFVKADAA